MKNLISNLKLNISIPAIITIILGVLFVLKPGEVINGLTQVLAFLVVLVGLVVTLSQVISVRKSTITTAVGVVIAVIGLYMFMQPATVASILPIIIGVILIVRGINKIAMGVEIKSYGGEGLLLAVVFGVVNILLGLLCICNAFSIVKFALSIMGIMLIVDGVCDLFIGHNVRIAYKIYSSTHPSEDATPSSTEIIEVEATEIDT